MELPSSDKFYSMSVESMDTSKLLNHATKQRDARKLDTFPIIDCDSHHYESESAAEVIDAENTLFYASDYPHWDMDVPNVIYDLPFLDEKQKRKILAENSRHVLNIDYSPFYPDYTPLS